MVAERTTPKEIPWETLFPGEEQRIRVKRLASTLSGVDGVEKLLAFRGFGTLEFGRLVIVRQNNNGKESSIIDEWHKVFDEVCPSPTHKMSLKEPQMFSVDEFEHLASMDGTLYPEDRKVVLWEREKRDG